jgi:hypothetical protein
MSWCSGLYGVGWLGDYGADLYAAGRLAMGAAHHALVPIRGVGCSCLTSTQPIAPHSVHLRWADTSYQFQSGRSATINRLLWWHR